MKSQVSERNGLGLLSDSFMVGSSIILFIGIAVLGFIALLQHETAGMYTFLGFGGLLLTTVCGYFVLATKRKR